MKIPSKINSSLKSQFIRFGFRISEYKRVYYRFRKLGYTSKGAYFVLDRYHHKLFLDFYYKTEQFCTHQKCFLRLEISDFTVGVQRQAQLYRMYASSREWRFTLDD